jgi:hypothetical protein
MTMSHLGVTGFSGVKLGGAEASSAAGRCRLPLPDLLQLQ